MTVDDLRERLQGIPGHWTVVVEQSGDGSGGGSETEYALTLDVERGNFPTFGGIAIIVLGSDA